MSGEGPRAATRPREAVSRGSARRLTETQIRARLARIAKRLRASEKDMRALYADLPKTVEVGDAETRAFKLGVFVTLSGALLFLRLVSDELEKRSRPAATAAGGMGERP